MTTANSTLLIKPADLGRETMKTLATRRLAPTPENYRAVYYELSMRSAPRAPAEQILERFADRLRLHPSTKEAGDRLQRALAQSAWKEADQVVGGIVARVISYLQVAGQAQSRTQSAVAPGQSLVPPTLAPGQGQVTEAGLDRQAMVAMSWLLGDLVEEWFGSRLAYAPRLAKHAHAIVAQARTIQTIQDVDAFGVRLADFLHQAQLAGEALDQMFTGLLGVVKLVVHNLQALEGLDRHAQSEIEQIAGVLRDEATPEALLGLQNDVSQFLKRHVELSQAMAQSQAASLEATQEVLQHVQAVASTTDHELAELQSNPAEPWLPRAEHLRQQWDGLKNELSQALTQASTCQARVLALDSELSSLTQQVLTDPMTGLLNRRGLSQSYSDVLASCQQRREALTIAVLDLDDFGTLNAQVGHEVGDQALHLFAQALKQALPPQAQVAHPESDEFVVLLPAVPQVEAVKIMRRLAGELPAAGVTTSAGTHALWFSFGVVEAVADEPYVQAMTRAHHALHAAQQIVKC